MFSSPLAAGYRRKAPAGQRIIGSPPPPRLHRESIRPFEDEVDPAKFVRGVMAGGTRLVISSGHDAPRLSLLLGGRSGECSVVVPIDLRRSWAKLRCERGRRVAALALLMRDGLSGLLDCCRVAARSASALRNDRRIFVAEMRVFVRV